MLFKAVLVQQLYFNQNKREEKIVWYLMYNDVILKVDESSYFLERSSKTAQTGGLVSFFKKSNFDSTVVFHSKKNLPFS
ncbi:hypothetical protein TNIN_123581 [Trichonephila inaurata madagascariensis]|uniref:Uncharacterized protein n=1 Tax=Trichonephila inaurata madagascariensis TaxID=2747483 RepID=A0A8X6IY63_9ARAC|nr:hypothetical protein TNIN_123581 [Trichonephila inaurata madagascariensis]